MTSSAARDVAFLTHDTPLPLTSGHSLRSYHLMRELSDRGWNVSLFSLDDGHADDAARTALRELCARMELVPFRRSRLGRVAVLGLAAARNRAFQRELFHSGAAAERARSWLAARPEELLVVDQLYMAPYVPPARWSAAVLDAHNAESHRVASMTQAGGLRGTVARRQLAAVRKLEQAVVRAAARTLAVSPFEQDLLDSYAPGTVDLVPNGVDLDAHPLRSALPGDPLVLFLGSLDYGANVDALDHLVTDVLPRVRTSGARLEIVGRRPGRRVAALSAASPIPASVAADVPSTAPWLARARVLAVPLRFGGGTRLKVLEALASGVPVVSTTTGVEGLGLVPGEDVLVADDPAAFAASLEDVLTNDEVAARLVERGRATVEERFGWRTVGDALERSLLRASGQPVS